MQTKLTGKQNRMTGIMNALGFGRKRGGAGAVVAVLAVCAIVASMTISVVGETAGRYTPQGDDIPSPTDDTQPIPWEKPITQAPPTVHYNGATPARLPC
jgi:hypothetical protein